MNVLRSHARALGISVFMVSSALPAFQAKLIPLIPKGLDKPVFVTTAPGEGNRLYIVEQRGRILTFENGKLSPAPFLNIESKVISGGEQGLLSVAFHPDYASNRRFYVNYTTPTPRLDTVVSQFENGVAEKEIIRIAQPYSNHNGGQIAFGHDGYLYIGMGDGGSAGDPENYSQNLQSLLGKMLRINVDVPGGSAPYTIPSDNPFLEDGKPEIYALGLRNPWRFSFDRATGALFTGDVGQYRWEEIDIIEKGQNYGWNVTEAASCFKPAQGCNTKGLTLPIFQYGRNDGISVTGGYVYRGPTLSELTGAYIFADYGSGKIWALHYDQSAKKVTHSEVILESGLPISSFGENAEGEILVVSHDGAIFQLGK